MIDRHERDSGIEAILSVGGYIRTPASTRWARATEAEPILRQWATTFGCPVKPSLSPSTSPAKIERIKNASDSPPISTVAKARFRQDQTAMPKHTDGFDLLTATNIQPVYAPAGATNG